MAQQLLKVDEWQSASGRWYVADVHTWTNWRALADILGVDYNGFIELIEYKYDGIIDKYVEEKDFLMFHWERDCYKGAHQFKLDVNRVARKKNYLVERTF